MTWTQVYNPLGSLALSALAAGLPVLVLLSLLAFFRVRAHWAVLAGWSTVFLVATTIYKMPASLLLTATGYGALYGLLPIGWIVLNVIFLYDITVSTGQFEVVKQSIADLSSDRRIQVLLISYSFGAFIEGAAGFGAPVAITSAMLIGIGFKPLRAASLALIGNTAPVAFGSLGIPIVSLAQVTGLPLNQLSAMVGRQLPFFSFIIPFWLVAAMSGWRGMKSVWPACFTAGFTFAGVQFLVSNFHGPWLVDTAAALASIVGLLILLRVWKPREIWRFEHETETTVEVSPRILPAVLIRAWAPWGILAVIVFVWALPMTKTWLTAGWKNNYPVPGLDQAVFRAPPLVPVRKAEAAVFNVNVLAATGTAPLLAAMVSGLILGLSPFALLRAYLSTLRRIRLSLLTISGMLALAFATRYAGLDSTLGLALASTGVLFPFFSPLLGWIGVGLTGSDTASNVLFGNLQQITARQLGLAPILTAAANSSGGVMGKMIDAQSIVVASVATKRPGEEGAILRSVFWHSVALAALVGVLIMLQAYLFPGMVP